MNNLKKKNTNENIADLAAIEEGTITSYSLLEEIIPLLQDYFVGNFEISENAIIMNFLNGQKFRLVIDAAC